MASRQYPLELILRAHGPAELVDHDEHVIWVSDTDDDFKEEFSDEFLQEEDLDDILDYLQENEIITVAEFNAFRSDRWDCTVETLDVASADPGDDDDGDGYEDDDEIPDDLDDDDEI